MFQFPRFPSYDYRFIIRYVGFSHVGFPIRIHTAHRLLAAPRVRFGAIPVLLRQLTPRHPPCARCRLAVLCSLGQLFTLSYFCCLFVSLLFLHLASSLVHVPRLSTPSHYHTSFALCQVSFPHSSPPFLPIFHSTPLPA